MIRFYNVLPEKVVCVHSGANDSLKMDNNVNAQNIISKSFDLKCEYILYLGTLEPRKNITGLIRAYNILRIKGIDVPLVIAGMKGWMFEDIFTLVKELKLEKNIIFTDYISHEEKELYILVQKCLFIRLFMKDLECLFLKLWIAMFLL